MPSKSRLFSQLIAGSGQIKADRLSDDISTIEQVATTEDLTAVGNTVGDQRVINNNLYIWNGSGWYRIALINASPTWDSGGQPAASYELDADSPQDATVITLAASDPDGLSISYNYVTSGSMDSMATISQDSSVFTITPKTVSEVGEGAELTGSITFRASDGVNILPYVSSFTLSFISIIENSRYTTLLATATGTSDNNNITDASTNNHTITVNGDAHAGTFSPYRSGGYSTYFDGSGDYIDTGLNNVATDFTFECWVNTTVGGMLMARYQSGSALDGFIIDSTSGFPVIQINTNANNLNGTVNLKDGKWHHLAFVRDSNVCKIFVDGVLDVSQTDSEPMQVNANWIIGRHGNNASAYYGGYIRDLRWAAGTVRYTSNFTPPTEPLTTLSGDNLFTCHLPYIVDGSSTPYTMTAYGNVSIEPFSPYDYLEYDAADHGGSVYFDGTGDYLVASNNTDTFGTGDFTLEGWIYRTATGATWQSIVAQRNGPSTSVNEFVWGIHNSGYMYFYTGAHVASTAAGVIKLNQWHHIAFTRSGSTLRQFVDGIQQVSGTSSNNLTYGPMSIGNNNGSSELLTAFLSDIKTTKGTALYTSNFTPPTEPISSANSLLHIKGTDASIIDKSQGSNLKMFGNTTGSTTQVKFADTKSMYFDGTGDYITAGADVGKFGTDDFTIETWLRSSSWNKALFRKTTSTSSSSPPSISVYIASATILIGVNSGTADGTWMSATNPFTLNTWGHLAITRVSGLVNVYADGSRIISTTRDVDVDNDITFRIGEWRNSTEYFTGYLQDFRITKGLARYTAADETSNIPSAPLEG